ncbi:MAG: peptidoglycan-binding protein [Oscillospiraceae bacterium]|jgi:hypothetical protein|nr:peptidoglycan-binding protein [Oscillospiraceae bacterium]
MYGNLIVSVSSGSIGHPVEGAKVLVTGKNTNIELITDSSGMTNKISLSTPDKQISITPSNNYAYGSYDISVSRFGLETKRVIGVKIFPENTSYQDVVMYDSDNKEIYENYVTLPDYYVGSYPPKIPEDPMLPLPKSRVQTDIIIPKKIVVHEGTLTNTSAANRNINYRDYIKNVASHEIYPTWEIETLKANIYAINSFTLNRMYTEWYRSQGYNFDITSSTMHDQAYKYSGTVFERVANVVDQVINTYLVARNNDYPFLSQYCDGVKVAPRTYWLSQWGSQDLGLKGYSASEIIRHYYTSAVSFATAPEEELRESFPGYNLKIEDCGVDVQILQNQLNRIRNNFPLIPRIPTASGKFNQETQNAVKIFQQVFKLPQTGIVDRDTWYKISYVYVSVANIAAGLKN